jgi:hypothetical protein
MIGLINPEGLYIYNEPHDTQQKQIRPRRGRVTQTNDML